MLTYDTLAQMYTGTLTGEYTGQLPPPNSNYTKVISQYLNDETIELYPSMICKILYAYFTNDTTVLRNYPMSNIGIILWALVKPNECVINSCSTDMVNITFLDKTFNMVIDDPIEILLSVWIYNTTHGPYYITSDNKYYKDSNGKRYIVNEVT